MASNGNNIGTRLWATADQLWANTGLRPSEFSTPVLGLIFLRYAEKRFANVETRIGPVGSPSGVVGLRISRREFGEVQP